jgi:site-specific DNA recombinase
MSPTHSTRNKTTRYRYYVCTSAQKRGRHTCPSRSIPAGEIERFVVEQIALIGRDPQLVAETIRQIRRHAQQRTEELDLEKRRLQRELASHHSELQNLAKLPEASHAMEAARFADVLERIASAEARLGEVGREADHLRGQSIGEADAGPALAEFKPVWEALSLREQGRLLQLLIERIDYDGHDGTLAIKFHPSGIKSLVNQEFQGDAA